MQKRSGKRTAYFAVATIAACALLAFAWLYRGFTAAMWGTLGTGIIALCALITVIWGNALGARLTAQSSKAKSAVELKAHRDDGKLTAIVDNKSPVVTMRSARLVLTGISVAWLPVLSGVFIDVGDILPGCPELVAIPSELPPLEVRVAVEWLDEFGPHKTPPVQLEALLLSGSSGIRWGPSDEWERRESKETVTT